MINHNTKIQKIKIFDSDCIITNPNLEINRVLKNRRLIGDGRVCSEYVLCADFSFTVSLDCYEHKIRKHDELPIQIGDEQKINGFFSVKRVKVNLDERCVEIFCSCECLENSSSILFEKVDSM